MRSVAPSSWMLRHSPRLSDVRAVEVPTAREPAEHPMRHAPHQGRKRSSACFADE